VVVTREIVGARAEPDLQPTARERLRDGELAPQEEGVTEGCVQNVDGEGDPLRPAGHRREHGRRIPRLPALRSSADVVEAREEVEAGFLGDAPGHDELLEAPPVLPGLDPDPQSRPLLTLP